MLDAWLFDSPTNLHCSQTQLAYRNEKDPFDSPTNLHCSQTYSPCNLAFSSFDSPTNLHCSQTYRVQAICGVGLIPLRICTALKPQMFEINDLRITCAISQVVFTHPYTNTKCRNLHPQYVCIHIQELDVRYFPVSVSVYLFLLYSAEINSSLHQKDNSANLPE